MERKTVSLMFLLVALIFTIVGGTFAYLTWQLTEENRNSLVFTVTGDFSCSVDGGGDVNTEGVTFMPVDSANCNNSEHILKRELTFNVVKNYTNDVKLYSWFNINNLGSYLRGNSNFKWVLSNQESCTEGIVKSGDFSELTDESNKIILFNDVYNETTISKYYLYMWLDKEETRIPDEGINSRIFDLSLDGECGENKVSIDSTITEITNYSTTPIPVIITNNNDYPVTANISFKDISLVENLEIPANTTINHDVYLSESAYKKGEKDVNNYLTISIIDNGLQINYNQIVGFVPGINYLGQGSYLATSFFGQEFAKANVKTITFMGSNTAPVNETRTLQGTIDVSEKSNGSIMAYYYESDTSGQYDFYIGSSDGVVYANPNSSYAFGRGYSNLTGINEMKYFDTSKVTNMFGMFYECSSLTILDVSNFDTSNVTNMSWMFYNCRCLTVLNVSNFDTSQVTNMSTMFYNCSGLTTLNVSNFDTSNVTNMQTMFNYCSGLTTLNVSNFDTSQVTNMSGMFASCHGLTQLDVSNFDTSNVTDMSVMFTGCGGLTTLNIKKFTFDSVTSYFGMFDNVPTSCKITVGSSAAKSWLNSKFSSYTNVVIG